MCKAQAWPGKEDQSPGAARELFPFPGVFRDVHDVVLEDEQIRRTFPRQAHHVLVVILDPAPHHFPIRQFDADRLLFLAKGFQISGFFEGLIRRRSLPAAPGCARSTGIERHLDILHGGSTVNAETVTHVAGTFCYPSSPGGLPSCRFEFGGPDPWSASSIPAAQRRNSLAQRAALGKAKKKAKPRQGRHRRPVAPASCWLSQEPALSLSKGRPHLFRKFQNVILTPSSICRGEP